MRDQILSFVCPSKLHSCGQLSTELICDTPARGFPAPSLTRFFYKQRVYKHTQPQIREILSTSLSTPPASDFEIDNKIS